MTRFSFFSLFYLSFTPLWISVLYGALRRCWIASEWLELEKITIIIVLSIFVLSGMVLFIEFRKSKSGATTQTIKEANEEKTITAEFLLAYILPLFAFDFSTVDGIVNFLIFFSIFGFLCITHNYFSVNIVLELFGYRLYKCKLVNDDGIEVKTTIVSRRKLARCVGEEIHLKSLNNDIKLDVD